jgi:hypothetical protein
MGKHIATAALIFASTAAAAMAAAPRPHIRGSAPVPLDEPRSVQAFDRCPATLPELWDIVNRLDVQSKTATGDDDANTTFYKPAGVTVLGTRPLGFQAYVVRGQPVRIYAKLPGRLPQYAALLPAARGEGTECSAERCEWLRTDDAPRYSLVYAYLVQDRAGRHTTLGCGYLR